MEKTVKIEQKGENLVLVNFKTDQNPTKLVLILLLNWSDFGNKASNSALLGGFLVAILWLKPKAWPAVKCGPISAL